MVTHPFRGGFWNQKGTLKRPLRYRPEQVPSHMGAGWGFVIRNGAESFNRPLYGLNNAFRVDGGDRPEWSFYFPGRGGVVRVGVRTGSGTRWLRDCSEVVTRYVDARLIHEVKDDILGEGLVRLTGMAMAGLEGLLLRVEWSGRGELELIVAYGGATGERGSRDGDIGTERVSVTEYFALRPEHCRGNRFEVTEGGWVMIAPSATVGGIVKAGSEVGIGDAREWENLEGLLGSLGRDTETPVVVGRVKVASGGSELVGIQRMTAQAPSTQPVREMPALRTHRELARAWAEADEHSRQIARRVEIETPDHFLNAAVAALCVAADGVFDGASQSFMHGAVAWRRSYLGWRGAYAGDSLGQPERTRSHLERWFVRQNTNPPRPDQLPGTGADEDTLLTRSKRMLHSSGDLTESHYDMNTVAFDALYRHLRWTGDLDYARRRWETITRHLEWQKRLFRREFPEGVLYEAYACIWASDDLQYSGGGVAHASAYQAFSFGEAARLARLLGEDPTPFEQERAAIIDGMDKLLWLGGKGWFAEYKDWLGDKLLHEQPAVWTHYHTLDGEFVEPRRAWEMTQYIEHEIPHIPLEGEGVPEGFAQISTTNWMPYTWSVNNVVLGETIHTALAGFQSGRIEQGYRLMKSAILDHMYMGICPGNLGMASYYDAYRRESQRDFSDAVGIFSRCVMEGVFGIRMDRLAEGGGTLTVRPGWPADWASAKLRHPSVHLTYQKQGGDERFSVSILAGQGVKLKLQIPARTAGLASVKVNGESVPWRCIEESVGLPWVEITANTGQTFEVELSWEGEAIASSVPRQIATPGQHWGSRFDEAHDPQGVIEAETGKVASGVFGIRTFFEPYRQGKMSWWRPVEIDLRSGQEIQHLFVTEGMLHLQLRNHHHVALELAGKVVVSGQTHPVMIRAASGGDSDPIEVPVPMRLPGRMKVRVSVGSDRHYEANLTDWLVKQDAGVRFESVRLNVRTNGEITRIFEQEYLSPRSPFCSLSIPKHGLGGWCTFRRTAEISDAVLKTGQVGTPWGFAFETDGTRAVIVSRWENHPSKVTIPLSGKGRHLYLLMAGTTNHMQCHMDNGLVEVEYVSGRKERLMLRSPLNWWPINEDFAVDDYQFRRVGNVPPRISLATGEVRVMTEIGTRGQGGPRLGGEANVIDLDLDPSEELKGLRVQALTIESLVGLLGVVIAR